MITSWIQTYTGKRFDPEAPEFDIYDIAHGLSNTCRFAGQAKLFYSVAEHSILVAKALEGTGYELEGLLHDAAEAYLGDVPAPIKKRLPDLQSLELRIEEAIAAHFGLAWPRPAAVTRADLAVLATEAATLMTPPAGDWQIGVEPARVTVRCYMPHVARALFIEKYQHYRNARK